jgi:putative membrane protein insertion efficiency factor
MNILSLLIKAAIFLYKICISPYIISSCRFVPSCSTYAIDALTKLPTRIALMRIIKRILRCNPLNKDDRLDRA